MLKNDFWCVYQFAVDNNTQKRIVLLSFERERFVLPILFLPVCSFFARVCLQFLVFQICLWRDSVVYDTNGLYWVAFSIDSMTGFVMSMRSRCFLLMDQK